MGLGWKEAVLLRTSIRRTQVTVSGILHHLTKLKRMMQSTRLKKYLDRGVRVEFISEPVEFRPGVWIVYFCGPDGEVCELRETPDGETGS